MYLGLIRTLKKRKDREGEQREREREKSTTPSRGLKNEKKKKKKRRRRRNGRFLLSSRKAQSTHRRTLLRRILVAQSTVSGLLFALLGQRHSGLVCPDDAAWRRSIGRTELLDEVAVLPERNLRRISSSGGRSSSARRPTSASATSTTSDRMLLRSAPLRRALLRRALLRSALLRRLARGGPPAPFLPRLALRLLRGFDLSDHRMGKGPTARCSWEGTGGPGEKSPSR